MVSNDNHGSDHQALVGSLALRRLDPTLRWQLPCWKKLAATETRTTLDESLFSRQQGPRSVEDKVSLLTDAVQSIQQSLGRRVRDNPNRSKSWWCQETLGPVVKTRNRARKWMILAKSPEAIDCYWQWNTYFLHLVHHLKQRAWRKLLEDPEEGDLYRVLRFSYRRAGGDVLPLRDKEGQLVHDKNQQAKLLFEGTSVTDVPITLADVDLSRHCRFVSYPTVKVPEVLAAINRIRPKKAAGIDGIANEMIKFLAPSLAPLLTEIYNDIFAASSFPNRWKCAVTAIIRKQGKPDYTNRCLSSNRPPELHEQDHGAYCGAQIDIMGGRGAHLGRWPFRGEEKFRHGGRHVRTGTLDQGEVA